MKKFFTIIFFTVSFHSFALDLKQEGDWVNLMFDEYCAPASFYQHVLNFCMKNDLSVEEHPWISVIDPAYDAEAAHHFITEWFNAQPEVTSIHNVYRDPIPCDCYNLQGVKVPCDAVGMSIQNGHIRIIKK